jgi:PAS domain S-box-containing protein
MDGRDDLFGAMLEASPDGVWALTPDGAVEYANGRCVVLTGAARPQARWRDYWPSESRFAADAAILAARGGKSFSFRAFLRSASGSQTYLDTIVSPVFDADGGVVRLVATSKDVTRDVERQAFLDTIIQLLPLPLSVKDARNGRYVLVNRAAEEAFGVVTDEGFAIGPPGRDAAQAPAIDEEEAEIIAAREARTVYDQRIETPSNGVRYFNSRRLATYDDAGARHLISLSEDVTERRADALALREALEAAEQASSAKSAFLANMSHEIRTPLNGIMAGADMLAQLALEPRAADILHIIRCSGEALERLFSDIFDLVRIESGQVQIEPAPFHCGEMVRSVAAVSRLEAEAKGLTLEVTVAPELDETLVGDAGRIRQVLFNLLNNAAKFTDHGTITVRAEAAPGGQARFTVADTGVGFAEETKARIFERFQQGDASFTRRFGGTGLGLAICRDLVELMGGRIDCEGRPGEGAAFWFELDLPPADCLATNGGVVASLPDRRLRVLVADDHPTNRKVIQFMLGEMADLVSAENGEEAVSAFRNGGIDLVLMDMQMPVMDGLAAVQAIREHEAAQDTLRVPIIMLTANARPEHVAASRKAGADLHLEKPITGATLFGAINSLPVRVEPPVRPIVEACG